MQGSRDLLEYKAPSIAGELKEGRDSGAAWQQKGELSAAFLGQGGEMPGLLMAQVWSSARVLRPAQAASGTMKKLS